mgnify:CR=1 FL=1
MVQQSLEGFNEEIYVHFGALHSKILACSAGISYPDARYEIQRKNSSHFSIEYVYEGSGMVQHNSETYHVSAGDFFILHPNAYHHYYANRKTPWKKIFLTLNGDPAFFLALLKLYKVENVHYLHHTQSPFELEDILELIKKETPNMAHELEMLLFKLVISISDFYKSNEQQIDNNKITLAKNFIERRITTKLTVDELSKYVNLNRSYLTRQFKHFFGLSPNEYILIAKIEYATNLLKTSNLSLEIIAYKLSFSDAAHFSHKFKQYTGLTPGKFRKLFQK